MYAVYTVFTTKLHTGNTRQIEILVELFRKVFKR